MLVGFVPHFLAFGFRPTEILLDRWAPVALVSSQLLLLAFAVMNIQPEVVQKLIPGAFTGLWAVGARFLMTKDMVLPLASTRLWFLDDRLIVPSWMNYPSTFSVGDVLIAVGAFWLLWSLGGPH